LFKGAAISAKTKPAKLHPKYPRNLPGHHRGQHGDPSAYLPVITRGRIQKPTHILPPTTRHRTSGAGCKSNFGQSEKLKAHRQTHAEIYPRTNREYLISEDEEQETGSKPALPRNRRPFPRKQPNGKFYGSILTLFGKIIFSISEIIPKQKRNSVASFPRSN